MAVVSGPDPTTSGAGSETVAVEGTRSIWRVLLRPGVSVSLYAGVAILLFAALFGPVGGLFIDESAARLGTAEVLERPSAQHWLGSDTQGRDLFTVLVLAVPETLKIGLIAGAVGLGIGMVLALIAGYFGGAVDAVVRVLSDALLTVPAIAVLVIIAANVPQMTVGLMGLTVAALAWMQPARTIRAQVLSIKERAYVEVARANGEREIGIVFKEVLPNLMPYVAASFVGAVGSALLAAIGLEALGLGANHVHTLGTTIYWAQTYAGVLRGAWWWWAPPIAMISIIFVGLFLVSIGLDRIANPRLRVVT